jgi:hypothetical protein
MSELRPDEQAEIDDESDRFPDSVTRDFVMAKDAAWLKTKDSPFADTVREYKVVESIFTVRAADNEFYVIEMRRRIAESIFADAVIKSEPFDTCMACYEDVVRLGIVEFEVRCTMTWYYGDCCRHNKRTEMGLKMVEPLIAELQRLLAEPNINEVDAWDYRQKLEGHERLLGKLQAQRKATAG